MVYKSIIFPLLRAKMAEEHLDIQTIADTLSINRSSLCKWFGGLSEPKLNACRRIRDEFFPDQKIEDLFDRNYALTSRLNEQYQYAPSKVEFFDNLMSNKDNL